MPTNTTKLLINWNANILATNQTILELLTIILTKLDPVRDRDELEKEISQSIKLNLEDLRKNIDQSNFESDVDDLVKGI